MVILQKEKKNNYLDIIQTKKNWYSPIGIENYISKLNFQDIIIKNTNNFFDDFTKLFPKM